MLFCMEVAFRISVEHYDAARTWYLEFEISIVWYYVESSKCGSSEQCVIAAVKGDDIED